jgi:DNA-binding winged helix-turn-helix (wHTH) protein
MKYFRSYRFDEASRSLWRGAQPAPLTKKAADLLTYFLEHAGEPLSHQQIMKHVWPDTHVQSQNIKTLVHEVRNALGDDPQHPAYIRADPGRGYTFIADTTRAPVPLSARDDEGRSPVAVGRDREMAALERCLTLATGASEPQFVLIEGERGWGKTSLCAQIADLARARFGARISLGQALDVHGGAEPYGALGEAMDLLARQYPHLVPALVDAHAPQWRRRARPSDPPAARARTGDGEAHVAQIVRELARVLDELSQDVPVLIVLEDLQWGDLAGVDWLRAMSRRRVPGRLMIVGTFSRVDGLRAIEALDRLGHTLESERCGLVLRLAPLTGSELAQYLERRFGTAVARQLAAPLDQATGGNPMLLTGAIETLIGLGRLQPIPGGWRLEATPDALDSILSSSLVGGYQWQIDNLGAVDRAVLEAAAAVGARFTAAAVAQALDSESVDVIDGRLAALADRRVLVDLALQHSRQPVPAGPLYRFRHPIAARLLLARTSDSLPRLADRLDAWSTFARRA